MGNTGMLGNISFAYNTWTHVAFQYNNQTKQQVRVFLFFFFSLVMKQQYMQLSSLVTDCLPSGQRLPILIKASN